MPVNYNTHCKPRYLLLLLGDLPMVASTFAHAWKSLPDQGGCQTRVLSGCGDEVCVSVPCLM